MYLLTHEYLIIGIMPANHNFSTHLLVLKSKPLNIITK